MQRQGMDFYTDEKAGVLLTRMTSDIEALSVLFQEGIVNFAVQALTLVVITGLLFNYDPLLAIVTLAAAVPPTVAASMWFRRRAAADYRTVRDRIGELLGNLQESLAGIRVIAAHDRRDASVAEHRDVVIRHRDAQPSGLPGQLDLRAGQRGHRHRHPGRAPRGGRSDDGQRSHHRGRTGRLPAVPHRLLRPGAGSGAALQRLPAGRRGHRQSSASCSPPSRPSPSGPGAADLALIRGEIVFDRVSFAYRADREVIHDVSLRIAAGETLAVVGETGSGKTTLARLIARLYDPGGGAVLIDGHDLRDVDHH